MYVYVHFWGQCGGKNNEHTKIVVLENRPNSTHFVAVFFRPHDKWGRQADESRSYKFQYIISSNIFPVHYDVFQPKTNWYLLDAYFLRPTTTVLADHDKGQKRIEIISSVPLIALHYMFYNT